MIHLAFISGDAQSSKTYYSRAPAGRAGEAPAWSAPVEIGDGLLAVGGALVGDGEGFLIAIYSEDGTAINAASSYDGGGSWSASTPILPISAERSLPFAIKLFVDEQRQVHVVWAENSSEGTGQTVLYAKLGADHVAWSEPIILATAGSGDGRPPRAGALSDRVENPSLVKHEGQIIVMYTACEPCERVMRVSMDDGQSWQRAFQPFESRGSYGTEDGFAVDSDNTLHLLLVDRARGNNLWHTILRGGNWGGFESVVSQAESDSSYDDPATRFAPYSPHAVVSQGNVLLVSWFQDPGGVHNGTWSSYKILDVPSLPKVVVPAPTVTALPTSLTPPGMSSVSTPSEVDSARFILSWVRSRRQVPLLPQQGCLSA